MCIPKWETFAKLFLSLASEDATLANRCWGSNSSKVNCLEVQQGNQALGKNLGPRNLYNRGDQVLHSLGFNFPHWFPVIPVPAATVLDLNLGPVWDSLDIKGSLGHFALLCQGWGNWIEFWHSWLGLGLCPSDRQVAWSSVSKCNAELHYCEWEDTRGCRA